MLEWEGGYKPANPAAINFQMPPGGQEVYRKAEYEDFNMNHKADWFKSIREGHHRPAVDKGEGDLCDYLELAMLKQPPRTTRISPHLAQA